MPYCVIDVAAKLEFRSCIGAFLKSWQNEGNGGFPFSGKGGCLPSAEMPDEGEIE
ncbi:MAG: hypothetical protein JRI74_05240 [Deltaproteobacteria bacterium]|nr:hypothetical protein [Deltaproteobacteria bacterium]MBW2216856.1 hypothetical protein [Deltaproteobacteria bacterium]